MVGVCAARALFDTGQASRHITDVRGSAVRRELFAWRAVSLWSGTCLGAKPLLYYRLTTLFP